MQAVDVTERAREAASYFTTATREDGTTYTKLRDDRPEWVYEMAREAHGDMLPDDWRYRIIAEVVEFIAESDDPDDPHEFADQAADIYTGDLTAWLGSHSSRPGYCDEAASQFGYDAERGIIGLIQLGQYAEASEVYASVLSSLRD